MSKRVLPNVLGIGAARSGTSWIYEILKSHPDIYMSTPKELSFFNWHYNKGLKWYKGFFNKNNGEKYIGEFTPLYLYDEKAPKLIKENLGKDTKFIVVLRNPIEREYSNYEKYKRDFNSDISFQDFLNNHTGDYGFYSKHINNWLEYFDREQFLILIYEEIVKNPKSIVEELSNFLNIDDSFNRKLLNQTINSSNSPRPYFLYLIGFKIRKVFDRYGFYGVSSKIETIGKNVLLKNNSKKREINLKKYENIYEEDIIELEKILGRNIDLWKK